MTARRSAWHAVPDAVGVAGQWRPADLRGLPATLRYGASLSGVALAAARGRPTRVVVVDGDGPVTGAELERAVDGVAAGLAAALREVIVRTPREVVVTAGSNRGLVAAVAATGALGIDAVLVAPTAGAELLTDALRGVPVALVDDGTAPLVAEVAPHVQRVDVGAIGSGRALRRVPRPRRTGAVRLFTSGTTGRPKETERSGAVLGQLATIVSLMRALELRRDEPAVIAPPLSGGHGLSLLTAALVVGAPAVLAHGRDGAGLIDLVREHDAGVLAVVPAQLVGVLDALEELGADLPSLRRVATGSAPLSPETLERTWELLGERLVDFYGSSEAGTATIATPEDLRQAPGTVGRPAAGVRVQIVDDTGAPLPPGAVGRVRIISPWRSDSECGHVDAGDLGHLDEHGRLFLRGRSDDVVLVGGHNVSLSRVRAWFTAQPGVSSAAVAAVEHAELGHELEVVVHGDCDLDELRERARVELGPAVAPRRLRRPGRAG